MQKERTNKRKQNKTTFVYTCNLKFSLKVWASREVRISRPEERGKGCGETRVY